MGNSMLGGMIMNRGWSFLKELGSSILPEEESDNHYIKEVEKAHSEWMAAQNYFENVADPDLVDYAIYELEAARRKYMYMLKQVRSK